MRATLLLASLAIFVTACGKDSTSTEPSIVAKVTVTPDVGTLELGATQQLAVTAEDADGGGVTAPVSFSSSNNGVATVSNTGLVTAKGRGTATITATAGGVQGQFLVTVNLPVSTILVTPASPGLAIGDTVRLSAVVKDSLGNVLDKPVVWQSGNDARASVAPTGLVTAKDFGEAVISASAGGKSGLATVTVQLTLQQISAHRALVCGLASNGSGYCWGSNQFGELGNGGSDSAKNVPVRVVGGVTFKQVVAGAWHACGLSQAGAAYCWGVNVHGQLGNGSNDVDAVRHSTPSAVAGGKVFASISAGLYHTCGVTTIGEGYCWGNNEIGLLGSPGAETCTVNDGGLITIPCAKSPRLIAGGVTFASLAVGTLHTCGLSTTGDAYCWGFNEYGAVGTGVADTVTRFQATAVTGGRTYTAITSGYDHSCAIATGGAAYCWGENYDGPLGIGAGDTVPHPTPVAVSGGILFASISASGWHNCGVATNGNNYCWGYNDDGQVGVISGGSCTYGGFSYLCAPAPVAVSGSVKFTRISAGWWSACGSTSKSGVYCWGWNGLGSLGNGSLASSVTPVPVFGSPLGTSAVMMAATADRPASTARRGFGSLEGSLRRTLAAPRGAR